MDIPHVFSWDPLRNQKNMRDDSRTRFQFPFKFPAEIGHDIGNTIYENHIELGEIGTPEALPMDHGKVPHAGLPDRATGKKERGSD
jgi:hypothetical protein